MAINQTQYRSVTGVQRYIVGLRDPLIQCGNQCGEYSRLFRLGGIALVIQLLVFAGVRLYMPALSQSLITIPQQECLLMEPPRWLAVFLTQLV